MKRSIMMFLLLALGVTAQAPSVHEPFVVDNPAYPWIVEVTSTSVIVRDKTNRRTYTYLTGGQIGAIFNGGESYATLDSVGLITLNGPNAGIWINGEKKLQ